MTDASQPGSDPALPIEILFPRGIPGFEQLTRYQFRYSDTDSGRIYRLVPEDAPDITFTLVEPRLYSLSYVLELTDEEQDLLQAESPEEIAVLLMLWKADAATPGSTSGLHANIAGPILINVDKGLGMQKIIDKPKVEMSISSA